MTRVDYDKNNKSWDVPTVLLLVALLFVRLAMPHQEIFLHQDDLYFGDFHNIFVQEGMSTRKARKFAYKSKFAPRVLYLSKGL